jgi:outer membrane lipoprotein-sorting protein
MIKRLITGAAVLLFVSGPAFAGHCPKDVKAIDTALAKGTKLSSSQISEVKKLRDTGAQQHKSGKHGDSLSTLHKALDMLGIKH